MKRQKHQLPKKNNSILYIAGIAVVVIVLAILLWPKSSQPQLTNESLNSLDQQNTVDQQEQEAPPVDATPEYAQTVKEESTPVSSNKVGEEGLCEDYFFEQGDSLEILDHVITVDRIGSKALRLTVDEKQYVLNDGDTDYLGDGIRISIAPGKILYFGTDDKSNAVQMRVGCKYNDNPNQKYVEQKGTSYCKQIYQTCQDTFDIDLD